ncbi:MAG: hypothetical protein D8M57_09820 [Candidatus Scalindua sp. AMX11]|nr:MAG: hypothetical protein DWQ00_08570 [Candidatus Scalindua sp.]NOG84895.1 hypothetical protein [Planctomycetota bacterium]RZV84962.1 MAG: hypothetical protein EX341_08120 [Candidatus Scalindua sp. SCAELEC01]TDE65044.1 MAG: hypothetical protein D8M57_09820 [Candidatus Scalindua sp. AMX11]GJQ59436.1 MAG: hypothetical protein SCALA701_22370 [Candidatus Scalindua sp.]
MGKHIIHINLLYFTFFSLLWFGVLDANQLRPTAPDTLDNKYLQGNRDERGRQCSKEVASSLGEACAFCHNDEVTLFTENGEKSKKMMTAAVAIGAKCSYCHEGKKRFTEKKEIADKMFELSEMMGVECDYCHAGNTLLTSSGKTAKTAMIVQEWGENSTKKCLKCHVEKKQFELNFHGWEVLNTQKGLLGL